MLRIGSIAFLAGMIISIAFLAGMIITVVSTTNLLLYSKANNNRGLIRESKERINEELVSRVKT
ncbi:MAG TPA: hypothetical protein VFH25_08205 [Nitrososphaeraceae archaeon]|nr:hypothetical protein [Nitrososphaeraceae archaeon]